LNANWIYLYCVRGACTTADWDSPKTIQSRHDTLLNSPVMTSAILAAILGFVKTILRAV